MGYQFLRWKGQWQAQIEGPKPGIVREWTLGFTYREHICAVTHKTIPSNPLQIKSSKGWAWRITRPQTTEESRIRIQLNAMFAHTRIIP